MKDKILNWLSEDEFLLEQLIFADEADGFDDAIIGVDLHSMRVIYSVSRCIEILQVDMDMNEEDASEYFDFNVLNAYVGEQSPIWCNDNF